MRKQSFELVAQLRLFHRPGQLAKVAATVAVEGALLGEITIVKLGDEETTRDVIIESVSSRTRRASLAPATSGRARACR